MHFGKSPYWFISVGLTEQLPNYPSINQNMSSVLMLDSSFLSFHLISSLCFALCPEAHSYAILFYFFLRFLQRAFLCIFFSKFYLCLIWSEKYILKVEFWSTKHQATLICYQKPPDTTRVLTWYWANFVWWESNSVVVCDL